MLIKGRIEEIKRVRLKAPNDSVHRNSDKDGLLKGVHSVKFHRPDGSVLIVPKGMVGAYFRYKENKGMKVFIQLPELRVYSKKACMKDYRNRVKLADAGINPKVHKVVTVHMDLKSSGKRKVFKAWAIKMDHVHYPEKAWNDYAAGYPYDFNCLDQTEHPNHNPEGYLKFAAKVYKTTKKLGITVCGGDKVPKLGDCVYCTKTKRWWFVDAG